jgi:hypothetical protein
VDIGDVAHIDHGAVDDLDRKIVELLDSFRGIIEIDDIFKLPDFLGADRRDLVLRGKRNADVLRGKTIGMQGALIEIDLYLPYHAAIRRWQGRPRQGGKLGPDKIQSEIVELCLRQRIAGKGHLNDGDA